MDGDLRRFKLFTPLFFCFAFFFFQYRHDEISSNGPLYAKCLWDKKRKRMARCRSIMFRIFRHECMKCGANKPLEIDHIKPKSIYPELYDYLDNMQILCRSCNKQKGFTLESDYRKDSHKRIIRLYAEKHNSMSYIKDKKFGLWEL